METRILDTSRESIAEAVHILRNGGLVAFPTETVYGLGADGLNPEAVWKIFVAKGRPQDNPLILHVSRIEDFDQYAREIPPYVYDLASEFSPGPLTFVLKKSERVPNIVTAWLDTVCLRIPNHRIALDLIDGVGRPIAAPSANRSGRPSPTEAAHVAEDLMWNIDAIVDGGNTEIGIESTVLDCTSDIPVILREGAVNLEMIEGVLGIELNQGERGSKKSPGTRYRHYAPLFPIEIYDKTSRGDIIRALESEVSSAILFFDNNIEIIRAERIFHFRDQKELSRSLFSLFRKLEKEGITRLYIERITTWPLELALMNRIEKAAWN